MNSFNAPEIKQLEKVLAHCGSSGDCDNCDFNWMEDHCIACYRVCAANALSYIKALKNVIDTYDQKIDKLKEVIG